MPAHHYGAKHQRARRTLLAQHEDGQHCPRCHRPMRTWQRLEADHLTKPASLYPGAQPDALTHRSCNRTAGWMLRDMIKLHDRQWAKLHLTTINAAIRDQLTMRTGTTAPPPRTSRSW